MRVGAIILMLLVGSGCQGANVEPGLFFPTWSPEGAVPAGIVQGVLARDDRCLFVEANDRRTLVVWEDGLGFEGDALLSSAGTPIAHLGETIHGGGGYFSDQAHMEDVLWLPLVVFAEFGILQVGRSLSTATRRRR